MNKIGMALGGGGAKGLAHISMLEVLDELGIRPHMISGTSIGAIMGALYASGLSAHEMREGIDELTASPGSIKEWIDARQLPAWLDFIGVDLGRGSLLKVDRFLTELEKVIGVSIDVTGTRTPKEDLLPSYSETMFNTFQIAEKTILNEKMKARPPSIYIEPEIEDVRVLEFHKADQIHEQTRPARDLLRRELVAAIG